MGLLTKSSAGSLGHSVYFAAQPALYGAPLKWSGICVLAETAFLSDPFPWIQMCYWSNKRVWLERIAADRGDIVVERLQVGSITSEAFWSMTGVKDKTSGKLFASR